MRSSTQTAGRVYLGREAALLLLLCYVVLLGGGFTAMVEFRLQAFSTVLATAVFGSWLLHQLLRGERIAASGWELALLLFLSSQLVAVIFSEDVRRSLPHTITWLAYVLAFYFALHLLRRGWPAELFEKCLLIAGALLLAFALVQLATLYLAWRANVVDLEFAPSFQQRITGILGDPNLLAAFTNLLLPLAVARAAGGVRSSRIPLLGFVAASLVVLYFTDSRGGMLGLGAGLAALLALWIGVVSEKARQQGRKVWDFIWRRKLVFGLLVALALAAGALAAWRVLSFEGDTTHAPVAEARDIYWQAATNAIVADPLTGAGPGMYPVYLMQIWSMPPARPYLHAHSLPFQVAAESGLFGLVAFGVLGVAIGRRAWSIHPELDRSSRARWAAAVAALVGLGVHSLVDDFFPFPAVGVVAMLLLAFVVSSPKERGEEAGFSPLWLGLPGLAAAVFSVAVLVAYAPADRAIGLGQEGDWQQAALQMSTAADFDPGLAIYWAQAGYAKAQLARLDPSNYPEAISDYQRAIELEPHYALNYANLAALYWSVGQQGEALVQMRIATSLAPESWVFWLYRGVYEEEGGGLEQASNSYQEALNLKPEMRPSVFWLQNELRASLAAEFEVVASGETAREQAAEAAVAGRKLVQQGKMLAAREHFTEAYELNDQEVEIYVGLAELAFAEVQLGLAEQYVQVALGLQATRNEAKIEAVLLGAELALAQSDEVLAMLRYETAYRAILAETSYGWGAAGWSPYAYFVFQRVAFPEDLAPQLVRADISIDIAQRLLRLAELYEGAGKIEKAQAVQTALQPYLP